jgi:hypothetical protein
MVWAREGYFRSNGARQVGSLGVLRAHDNAIEPFTPQCCIDRPLQQGLAAE